MKLNLRLTLILSCLLSVGSAQVFLNAPGAVTICPGQSVSISATGLGASTFTWNTGATTPVIVVNPSLVGYYTYTVFGNNMTTAVAVIAVISPNFLSASSPTTNICATTTATLIGSGANTYTWLNTGSNFSTTYDIPLVTETYTLVGKIGECADTTSITINVQPQPFVTISSTSPTLCSGSSATLTALGASGYVWSGPGSPLGATLAITPTLTSAYTVTGTTSFGCWGICTGTVVVQPRKDITGTVTSASGIVNGKVSLYEFSPVLSLWDSVSTVPISSSGYQFPGIKDGTFVVKALPVSSVMQDTYGTGSVSWQGATQVAHGCLINSTVNINVAGIAAIGSGAGSLSGKILKGSGFGNKSSADGDPVAGVLVKTGKNPGGVIFAQQKTVANGSYSFSNIPDNLPGENYFILVDIPGLDTNGTYRRIITPSNEQHTGLDFVVDSARINPVDLTTGISRPVVASGVFAIYPNPAQTDLFVKSAFLENNTEITILSLQGQILKQVEVKEQSETVRINIEALEEGVYFIKLKASGCENVRKLAVLRH